MCAIVCKCTAHDRVASPSHPHRSIAVTDTSRLPPQQMTIKRSFRPESSQRSRLVRSSFGLWMARY